MYDNGYIVKCRSILTNDICLSEASHKADVFLVCISYLTYSLKKCYNRGIQMYRFPNSDVQKSVIFEGIKKRLKIV